MTDGTAVAVATGATDGGVPLNTAAGIGNAVKIDGFTYNATGARFQFTSNVDNCWVTYDQTTGTVAVISTGC
ncbi:MAG TPA: hypothetical protein VM491_16990 [Burkholderiaceae bacterium]|nr:hypothetical protein [Burkholderiaceae bacterium]